MPIAILARRFASIAVIVAGSAAAPAVHAQQSENRLSIHGYLTQGYGISSNDLVVGLSKQGTADYRRAAVVARYLATPNDHFVVQLGHRRLGDSPSMQFEDNVKLDMAFYEHRFRTGTSIRLGKTLLPFGIFNEIRYAGTLLPFYRPAFSVYSEGTQTSETIDGVALSHRFRSGEPWGVDVDVYGGSFTFLEFGTIRTPANPAPQFLGGRMRASSAFGGQLWLNTPVEGVRLGMSGNRHWDKGGVYPRGEGELAVDWTGSVDASFDKWQLRAEGLRLITDGFSSWSRYAQVSVRPFRVVSFNVQTDSKDLNITPPPIGPLRVKIIRDQAASVNIFFDANTVFKLEAHSTRGHNVEQVTDIRLPPRKGSYFISSFSVSF